MLYIQILQHQSNISAGVGKVNAFRRKCQNTVMQKMHRQSLPAICCGKRRVALSRDSFTDIGENDIEVIKRFLTYGPHTLLVLLASET